MVSMRDLMPWSRRDLTTCSRLVDHPLVAFQREVDRLFEDFWRGIEPITQGGQDRGAGYLAPRIDVREDEHAITVCAELPGLEQKDVEITLAEKILTIRGEKKTEAEEQRGECHYSERSFGTFQRRIAIDAEIEDDKITADFANGVLTVTLPKSAEAEKQVRRINIGDGRARVAAASAAPGAGQPAS